MESLQQATDGDGQRRNTQRYRESNVTTRRYTEDKQYRKPGQKARCNPGEVPDIAARHGRDNPLRVKRSGQRLSFRAFQEQTQHSVTRGS